MEGDGWCVLLVCREVGRVMGGVCYWCVGRWGGRWVVIEEETKEEADQRSGGC